ncbi:MAG: thioredoxin-disulfide reductase [Chitinispirillaceae bacterium]|nr:thioredoxin-disulfide reductase [Chitinispirillaceae bacterium]
MATEHLIIIGSGPAGLTAAIYAARSNLKPLLFEGFIDGGIPGGQLMITTVIENFPGFPHGIAGPKLMANMREQAIHHGTRMITEDIAECCFAKKPFTVTTTGGDVYTASAVIIASGATARRLPLESEQRLWNRGISACATCDGSLPIFRDKELAVIGGGDTAIEEALHLTQFASKVYLIHRRSELRASKAMQIRLENHPKIEVLWNKVIEEFVGEKRVEALALRDTVTAELSRLPVAGVFEAIGHVPNTGFLKGQVATNDLGYIVTLAGSTKTNIEGVFAAGDVQDHKYRQAVTAAGSGCMAAKEAEVWLQENGCGC